MGRFIQPDSIVPGTENPQAWNRYSYVSNSPVNFNDPSGHGQDCGIGMGCVADPSDEDGIVDGPGGGGNDNGGSGGGRDNGKNENYGCKQLNLSDSTCGCLIGGFTNATILIDHIALFISAGEAAAADFLLIATIIITIFEPEFAPAIGVALKGDFLIANGLGLFENTLGGASVITTGITDWLTGSTKLSDGLIGKDTIVAARNAILGLIPESNVDFVVSASQLKYDMERLNGEKSGGSVNIADLNSLFDQIVWYDSPLQDIVNMLGQWKKQMSNSYGR